MINFVVNPGTVYLVGAGPGAADLITRRGLTVLRRASAVLYDALIEPDLLAEASPGAELVAVGKRGYCVGSTKQEHINDLLVRYARAGHSVCRLKGGDPGVFGRGGEEAAACADAGVPVVFVPGVTAACAAAAAGHIPLTHRDAGQSLAFVTGHHDPDSDGCTHDWAVLARVSTLVVYMGVRHIPAILSKLVAAGLSAQTPAAVVSSATTVRERVVAGTVADLPARLGTVDAAQPAVLVVGTVVGYRDALLGLAGELVAGPADASVY